MRRYLTAAVMIVVTALGSSVRADSYKADTSHAHIGFSIGHMVISKVKGSLPDFEASLELDGNKLAAADAKIKVASIDTDNAKRDEHLKAADFFDAEKFPFITFKSKKVTEKDGKQILVGDFTIRDVTKEVSFPVTIKGPVKDPWGNTKLGFGGSLTINRKDYGLTWHKVLETGGLVVDDEVEINIDVEFAKAE